MTTDHLYMPKNHMDKVYTSSNYFVKKVHLYRIEKISEIVSKKKGSKILDAGCGEGHLIELMYSKNKDLKYYGFDITKEALDSAKKRCPYASIQKDNLIKLSYKDETFDSVTCTEVIEHVYEYKQAFFEMKRVLKKGGYLILSFPNEVLWTMSRIALLRRPFKVPDHVNSFTPSVIKKAVGLKVVEQINYPFGLFPISLGCIIKFRK